MKLTCIIVAALICTVSSLEVTQPMLCDAFKSTLNDFEMKVGIYKVVHKFSLVDVPFIDQIHAEFANSIYADRCLGSLAKDIQSPEKLAIMRNVIRYNTFGSVKFNQMFNQTLKAGQGIAIAFNLDVYGDFTTKDLSNCDFTRDADLQ